MAAYGPAMMALGFVVSSAIMIALLATFYGNRNYYLTAFVSIIVPVAIFYHLHEAPGDVAAAVSDRHDLDPVLHPMIPASRVDLPIAGPR